MHPFLPAVILIGQPTPSAPAADREILAMGTTLSIHVEGGHRVTEAMVAEVPRI